MGILVFSCNILLNSGRLDNSAFYNYSTLPFILEFIAYCVCVCVQLFILKNTLAICSHCQTGHGALMLVTSSCNLMAMDLFAGA